MTLCNVLHLISAQAAIILVVYQTTNCEQSLFQCSAIFPHACFSLHCSKKNRNAIVLQQEYEFCHCIVSRISSSQSTVFINHRKF